MNITPAPLLAVKRDLSRVRSYIQQVNLSQQTALQVRRLLNRLTALRTRLLRCRHVIAMPARKLRTQLLRSSFALWRSLVKRLALIPAHSDRTAQHFRQLVCQIPPADPHNWALRLMTFDVTTLRLILPELLSAAPQTARDTPSDPYWKALKGNLSQTAL